VVNPVCLETERGMVSRKMISASRVAKSMTPWLHVRELGRLSRISRKQKWYRDGQATTCSSLWYTNEELSCSKKLVNIVISGSISSLCRGLRALPSAPMVDGQPESCVWFFAKISVVAVLRCAYLPHRSNIRAYGPHMYQHCSNLRALLE
jgi:hypothetical protein